MCSGGGSGSGGNGNDEDMNVSGNEAFLSNEVGLTNVADNRISHDSFSPGVDPSVDKGGVHDTRPALGPTGTQGTGTINQRNIQNNLANQANNKRNIIQKTFDAYDDMHPALKIGTNVLTAGMNEGLAKALTIGNVINKTNDEIKRGEIKNEDLGVHQIGKYGTTQPNTYSGGPNPHSDIDLASNLGTSINTGTEQLNNATTGWGKSLLDSSTLGASLHGGKLGTNNMLSSGTIGQNIISGTKRGLIDPISGLEIKSRNLDEFGKGFN